MPETFLIVIPNIQEVNKKITDFIKILKTYSVTDKAQNAKMFYFSLIRSYIVVLKLFVLELFDTICVVSSHFSLNYEATSNISYVSLL